MADETGDAPKRGELDVLASAMDEQRMQTVRLYEKLDSVE